MATPTKFIVGEADFRVPGWTGSEEMFRALKYRKVETMMVRFPDETHDMSRSGKPWHRVERLQHIVGWFDYRVMGKGGAQYEMGLRAAK